MMTVLVALRDALIAMALAWVGVTLERPATERAPGADHIAASAPACDSASGLCVAGKPGFNALDCEER